MAKHSLKQFVSYAAKLASVIFERQGELTPIYHVVTSAGQEFVVRAPPGDKDQSIALMRNVLENMEAVRFVFIDEAWMLQDAQQGNLDKIGREGVVNQPGRIEVILLSAEDQDEGMLMAHREIIRHGNHVKLGALQFMAHDQLQGRFVGMLPHKGRLH